MNTFHYAVAIVLSISVIGACNGPAPQQETNAGSRAYPRVETMVGASDHAAPTSSTVSSAQRLAVESLIAEGSVIMKETVARYPNTEPCIGDGSSFLMVGVPEHVWSSLTAHERVALSYYVESRIPFAREVPGRYLITPSDAPIFSQFAAAVRRNLCDTCWTIVTGSYSRDGGVSPDRALLNGDGCATRCWDRAAVAGEFRRETTGTALPPVTWKVGPPEGEPSCTGYAQPM